MDEDEADLVGFSCSLLGWSQTLDCSRELIDAEARKNNGQKLEFYKNKHLRKISREPYLNTKNCLSFLETVSKR